MPKRITIHSPIWKTRSVGIADYKITDDILLEIDYKNQQGERIYPDTYFIKKQEAKKYPIQIIYNLELRIIPIARTEELFTGSA